MKPSYACLNFKQSTSAYSLSAI